MSVLWCGGEDVDFPTRHASVTIDTVAGHFRNAYARGLLVTGKTTVGTLTAASNPFPGGGITSGWFSFYFYYTGTYANWRGLGLGKSGTVGGLAIGSGSASNKLALYKVDSAGTATRIWEEVGTSFTQITLHRLDVQFSGWGGAAGTVRVYLNGALIADLSASADLTAGGVANLDNVTTWGINASSTAGPSEIIVADEDTRLFSLATLAPSGAGDANTFTSGTYADIDEFALSDADLMSSAVAEQAAQIALTDVPAGNFICKAVKVAARCADGVGGMAVQVGVKTNGAEHLGAQQTLDGSWKTVEQLYQNNPATLNRFTVAELNALQAAFKSKAA